MLGSTTAQDSSASTLGKNFPVDQARDAFEGHDVVFHVLSFEGPDPYSRAGGVASRINGLTAALAAAGFETHLWFVGDPSLPGHQPTAGPTLHRWCQWISQYHPAGVYDGEEGKRSDYAASLPPFLLGEFLLTRLREDGKRAVVLAEEWHTADAVLHLDALLRHAGIRDRVTIFWNANNVFGFHRIDWQRLAHAAIITTVSRYMRYRMWNLGVDPLVVPNGVPGDAFQPPDRAAVAELRKRVGNRTVLAKVARWDPDKRWLLAVDTVAQLKRHGRQPLLIARGGIEAHGAEVLWKARTAGLRVVERALPKPGVSGLIESVAGLRDVDVLSLRSALSPDACRLLYRSAAAVLANSSHEPFGLVGLETMAAGGLACTGSTGEDYALPGWNALVLQTDDPREFVRKFDRLRANPSEERALRRRGTLTAEQFAWSKIAQLSLFPHVPIGVPAPNGRPLGWRTPAAAPRVGWRQRGGGPSVQDTTPAEEKICRS
jgi:glycosyltransferase involved in cell wall biosynthesis